MQEEGERIQEGGGEAKKEIKRRRTSKIRTFHLVSHCAEDYLV